MRRLSAFRNSIVIISVTIILILGSQVYRTINNYQLNKQRFINDVQLSLDQSIEKYYAEKARNEFRLMTFNSSSCDTTIMHKLSSVAITMDTLSNDTFGVENEVVIIGDSLFSQPHRNGFQYSWSSGTEDVNVKKEIRQFRSDSSGERTEVVSINITNDSSDRFPFSVEDFGRLTQKIIISSSENRINVEELSKLLDEELERRNLGISYQLEFRSPGLRAVSDRGNQQKNFSLTTSAKNTYLSDNENLKIHFNNASLLILKRGAWDLLLSFAIVFSVIGALLYLYRVIKNQKELAMIKDDLIGNVTHEFKTPIATVSSALEGIANFNETDDKEKTKRYLEMSRDQLSKLNVMVEKLMETATIDSGEIEISKVETDLTALAGQVAESFKVRMGEKALKTEIPSNTVWGMVDPFHWENVLSNLLDNAIKYGGDEITLKLLKTGGKVQFQVIDNGGGIDKIHKDRIFEKLYRIPKGNQHDVKGFGIGLYYTKAIVEGHGGSISLESGSHRTCFTVTI